MIPLFHSDVFIKENVGTDEQRRFEKTNTSCKRK